MFVVSKTIDTIDDLWLKRKQGLEWGILLLNFHSIFTFSSSTFFVVFLNPIFLFPKYISSKSFGRKKVEEMKRKRGRFFSPSLPTPIPSMFFPAHFSLHLLQSSSTDYYLGLEDSSDLREQSWDHCTVSHILSLTDQIILRLIIDVKSLSNYWYARTTSSFLASSCNSGALVRSSVCKLLLLDSLGQFFYL